MTFRAEIYLPVVLDINGMDEFHRFVEGRIFHFAGFSLGYKGMAEVAILRNGFSLVTDMAVGVAPEASVGFKMADMIQVFIGGNPHFGENVICKTILNTLDSLLSHCLVLRKNVRVHILIISCYAVADIHKSGIGG